jgi:hypothetical protein
MSTASAVAVSVGAVAAAQSTAAGHPTVKPEPLESWTIFKVNAENFPDVAGLLKVNVVFSLST